MALSPTEIQALYTNKKFKECLISIGEEDSTQTNITQAMLFKDLGDESKNSNLKVVFFIACLECYSRVENSSLYSAGPYFGLGEEINSTLFYKKALLHARIGFDHIAQLPETLVLEEDQQSISHILEIAEDRIVQLQNKDLVQRDLGETSTVADSVDESVKSVDTEWVDELKLFWSSTLKADAKRKFLKVTSSDLHRFFRIVEDDVEIRKLKENSLEQTLTYLRKKESWKLWVCKICFQKFSEADVCKNHLQEVHSPKHVLNKDQAVSNIWAHKISSHECWEPLDAGAAFNLIMDRFEDVKGFKYASGWCEKWPLDTDVERKELLKDIRSLLVSAYEKSLLTTSIRNRVMYFVRTCLSEQLGNVEDLEDRLTDCGLLETPQGICLLDNDKLLQILVLLRRINCQRNDGTDQICRAVESLCRGIQVKEKIECDPQFSCLLLDKRLLQGSIEHIETGGKVSLCDPDLYYARSPIRKGDHIVTWLFDRSSETKAFKFPAPIKEHNLCIWVAVLRCLQFACRSLKTKFAKKLKVQDYEAKLSHARELCTVESERRKTVPENEWISYGNLLYNTCENIGASSLWCTVRDILTEASIPSFDMPGLEAINAHTDLTDARVINSINCLHLEIKNKDLLIDSRILLIEKSRVRLLDALTDLSIFDYRFYILPTLKKYLLHRLTGWSDGEPIP